MIDYDLCYTTYGEVTFNIDCTIIYQLVQLRVITNTINDSIGASVNITIFLNKTITNVENIVTVNRWYPNKYYYLFTFDSGESYQMYFNRMKLHKQYKMTPGQ